MFYSKFAFKPKGLQIVWVHLPRRSDSELTDCSLKSVPQIHNVKKYVLSQRIGAWIVLFVLISSSAVLPVLLRTTTKASVYVSASFPTAKAGVCGSASFFPLPLVGQSLVP